MSIKKYFVNNGDTFGNLTVINNEKSRCLTKCICGVEVIVRADVLVKNKKSSCGKFECKVKQPKDIRESCFKQILTTYKKSASERNLNFDLSFEEFKNIILQNCHYCGSFPKNLKISKRTYGVYELNYNGIDRKNSELGYQLDNCVPSCWICNRAKGTLNYKEFKNWINNLITFSNNDI